MLGSNQCFFCGSHKLTRNQPVGTRAPRAPQPTPDGRINISQAKPLTNNLSPRAPVSSAVLPHLQHVRTFMKVIIKSKNVAVYKNMHEYIRPPSRLQHSRLWRCLLATGGFESLSLIHMSRAVAQPRLPNPQAPEAPGQPWT